MDLVDTFYQSFLFFSGSSILMGFKLGEQVFDDPGVDLIVGGGSPYGRSVSHDIHESRIESRRRHDDKFGGYLYGEIGPATNVS